MNNHGKITIRGLDGTDVVVDGTLPDLLDTLPTIDAARIGIVVGIDFDATAARMAMVRDIAGRYDVIFIDEFAEIGAQAHSLSDKFDAVSKIRRLIEDVDCLLRPEELCVEAYYPERPSLPAPYERRVSAWGLRQGPDRLLVRHDRGQHRPRRVQGRYG